MGNHIIKRWQELNIDNCNLGGTWAVSVILILVFSLAMALNQLAEGATEIQHFAKVKWSSSDYHGIRIAERIGLFLAILSGFLLGAYHSIPIVAFLLILAGNGIAGLSWYEYSLTKFSGQDIWRKKDVWQASFLGYNWEVVRDRNWKYYIGQLLLGYTTVGIGIILCYKEGYL